MKVKKLWFLSIVVVIILLMNLAAYSADEKVWELKLGSKMYENNPESQGVKKFIELAEERSGGRLKIIPYWGQALGDDKTQIENVMTGLQDLYIESYSYYAPYVPEFSVHTLGFFFNGNEEYQKFLLSPIEKEMEDKLIEKIGVRILNSKRNWVRGPFRTITSRKPITSLEDLQGVKLRLTNAPISIKLWSTLGTNTVIVPWTEVYLALQQGMVDAVTCSINGLNNEKFYELVKNVTITNEYPQQLATIMNERKFQALPEDLQKILIDALDEGGEVCTELVVGNASNIIENLKKEHGVTFYEIDLVPWLEKAKGVHKALEASGDVPVGLTDRIIDLLR